MVKSPPKQREKYSPRPKPTDECQCTRATAAKPSIGELTHLFPYYDENEKRLYSRFRYLVADPKSENGQSKTFRYCEHYDRTNPQHVALLYGLHRVKEAVRKAVPKVFLVEGEGDCEAAWALEDAYTTTTHLGTRFPLETAEHFRGYAGIVYIVVDRDHLDKDHQARFNNPDESKRQDYPGAAAALRKWRALKSLGVKVFFREAIRGKDMRDHLEAGKSLASLRKVSLEQIKERAPKEAADKRIAGMALSIADKPEGPGMSRFVQALEAKRFYLEKIGPTRYKTNCPHPDHDDNNPSFEFEQGDKGVLMTCQSGRCTYAKKDIEEICRFLGIRSQDLFDKSNGRRKSETKAKLDLIVAGSEPVEFPAFHPAFEGHIGRTTNNEPNDKSNGKRMADLYGKVFRKVTAGSESIWRCWTGTHWGTDTASLIFAAAADLSTYMERVEVYEYVNADGIPAFPSDWDVYNSSGKPYKSLLGRYGALTHAPAQAVAYAAKGPEQAQFLGERLKAEQDNEELQDMLKWIDKCKDGPRMREAVKQLEHQPGISVRDTDFDNVRGTFVVQNGQINTRTMELEPHCLEDMNTRLVPVSYREDATAPIWERYLSMNQPNEETRRYLQKLVGYAISGDGDQKLIAFLYSRVGDTGKSLFLRVVEKVLGSTYAATLAEGALSKRRFDTGGRDPDRDAIRGKRFVVSSELAPNEPLDERFVKQLTGGDGVSTRGNYSKEGNTRWQPECLVLVATNHLSRINAEDEAIWNRIQVVPWKVAFPKGSKDRDEQLAEKILGEGEFPGEVEGVLAWIVEGLRLYREEGLVPPSEVVEASMGYRTNTDIVQLWILHAEGEGDIEVGEHSNEKDGERYVSQVTPLHDMFERWSKKEHARDIPGLQAFGRRLEELGYTKVAKYRRDPYKGRAVILGIRITPEAGMRLQLEKS